MKSISELPETWQSLFAMDDLTLKRTRVPPPDDSTAHLSRPPPNGRYSLEDQLLVLRRGCRGRSYLSLYHAATIVLIRRELLWPEARQLFFEIWDRNQEDLLTELNGRWLVSAADTFADHGRDTTERALGFAATLFANALKAYESERLLYGGLRNDTVKMTPEVRGKILFDGITVFNVDNDDTIANMFKRKNALQVGDSPARGILDELVERSKTFNTIYKRFLLRHKSQKTLW